MGDRLGACEVKSNRLNMVDVHCRITFGATGAPTLTDDGFGAVSSITRSAAGRYTIVFNHLYNQLYGLAYLNDCQGTATGGTWETYTGWVASTGTIVLSHVVSGSEADPASGVVTDFIFKMKASSEG